MRAAILLLGLVCIGRAASLSRTNLHLGMCDASGAAAISTNLFVIADDEDNKLRIYHSDTGGLPLKVYDTTGFLRVDPKEPEVDLEGAARLGDRIYWITSHGRNRQAKYRESRLRFFATDLEHGSNHFELKPVGQFYSGLLLDLFNDPRLSRFKLADAARHAPKERGALNIEGLSATPDGKLIIGFRNPIPQRQALLVPLLNPAEAIDGKPLRLGDPILLDLGNRGIRSMALHGDKYVIIAGAYDERRDAELFLWSGGSSKPVPVHVDWGDLTPEALATYPGHAEIQIFSDDGMRSVGGQPCKNAPPDKRLFRSVWIGF